jgi:uncharacterized protein YbjT (DUF2867 family)
MKRVVIGGPGRIGAKTVALRRGPGHEGLAAAPEPGVDPVTGEGLALALAGADVVVDLANSRAVEPAAVLACFTAHEQNLLAAEARAGVQHHVVLSIVGTDCAPDNGYLRAQVAQEALSKGAGVPYTVMRSTQCMEFLGPIADAGQQVGARPPRAVASRL